MRIKVLIVLPSLKAGGAERVLSFLSNKLDKKLFEVKLVIFGFKKDAVYELDENIVFLDKDRLLSAIPGLIKLILKFNPKIIIGSIIHVNVFLGLLKIFFRKKKVILREASVISKMSMHSSNSVIFNRKLVTFFYSKVDKIICQSHDMLNDFKDIYNIEESKLIVINNPITQNLSGNFGVPASASPIQFITVGRLSSEKGYFRILDSLSKIKDFDFRYTVIGDGPLKEEILHLVEDLGLSDKITYISHTNDVYGYLAHSHLFLQGSYVEGFPNGVLESCFVGTPVLAFAAPGGTSEIIHDSINGFIVDNNDQYLKILNSPYRYLNLSREEVKQSVVRKFSPEKILSQYQQLLQKV